MPNLRESPSYNVLMTGAGAPGAAGIIHCLSEQPGLINLTVADADVNAVGRYLAKNFVQLPRADDPEFITAVRRICAEKNIQLVLPLVTKELFPLSRHKRQLQEEGTKILVSSEEAINIANNKSACYQFLQARGIEMPKFKIVHTVEDFIYAAFESGHPQQPFCFKPSVSNGSRGVRVVSDSLDEADQLFNHKPYNLNITYAHALKILSSQPFPELLVSEYLPGEEYSVDCIADHGKTVIALPRKRLKTINGISVQGEFVKNEQVIGYCEKIIKEIGLHGNIGIQVKYSAGGHPFLLEINPRVQGTIVSALGAGVNLPLLAILMEMEAGCNPSAICQSVQWGTRFSRYWKEVYYYSAK